MNLKTMHRRDDPQTSVDAAKKILPRISNLQFRVYEALLRHFFRTGKGMTDKELEKLPEFKDCGYSTVRKRRTDLMHKGYVVDSGEKRDGLTVWEPIAMDHLREKLEAEARGEKPLWG